MPQKLELSPALAERIKALFDAGHSRRKIATVLQEDGYVIPADSRRKTWHHSLVSTYLEQLGLVSPPRWILKPGLLGEGAKRWEELLAAPHTLPAGQGAVSAPAVAGPPQPAEAPAPTGAGQPAASAPEPGGPRSLHIAVDGPCTPADRRLWFSLVRVARPELGHKPRHDLPRAHALALLAPGPTAPGPADLWGAMKRLRASGITWEARFDGRPLLITTPLISGVLTTTALTFHFSPELVTLLLDDTQFARLRALLGRAHDALPSTV